MGSTLPSAAQIGAEPIELPGELALLAPLRAARLERSRVREALQGLQALGRGIEEGASLIALRRAEIELADLPVFASDIRSQAPEQAAALYDELALRLPADPAAQLRAMRVWASLGKADRAADAAERALAGEAVDAHGRALALTLLAGAGRWRLVAEARVEALRTGPVDRRSVRAATQAFRAAGRSLEEIAQVIVLRGAEIALADLPLLANELRAETPTAAAALDQEVCRRLPEDPAAQLRAMRVWASIGQADRAADAAERALACEAVNAHGRALALTMLAAAGRWEPVARARLEALRTRPVDRRSVRDAIQAFRTASRSLEEVADVIVLRRAEIALTDLSVLASELRPEAPRAAAALYDELALRRPAEPAAQLRAIRAWASVGHANRAADAAERALACEAVDAHGRALALRLLAGAGRWQLVADTRLEMLRNEPVDRRSVRDATQAFRAAERSPEEIAGVIALRRAEIALADLPLVANELRAETPTAAAALDQEISRRLPEDPAAQLRAMRAWASLGKADRAADAAERALACEAVDARGRALALTMLAGAGRFEPVARARLEMLRTGPIDRQSVQNAVQAFRAARRSLDEVADVIALRRAEIALADLPVLATELRPEAAAAAAALDAAFEPGLRQLSTPQLVALADRLLREQFWPAAAAAYAALARRRGSRSPELLVPDRLKRGGSRDDRSADLGLYALREAASLMGGDLSYFDGKTVLDVGCGHKQAEAIVKYAVPVKRYVGIDSYAPLMQVLARQAEESVCEFHHVDAFNQRYSPTGKPMDLNTVLPIAETGFDLIHAWSLFSHLKGPETEAYFTLLRRYTHARTTFFFTIFLSPGTQTWRDSVPDQPLLRVLYGPEYLDQMLRSAGWGVERVFVRDAIARNFPPGWEVKAFQTAVQDLGDLSVALDDRGGQSCVVARPLAKAHQA